MLHHQHLADLAAPSLPGALCRDEWQLYDAASGGSDRVNVAHAPELALAICAVCPVLTVCRDWFDSLPAWKQPHGRRRPAGHQAIEPHAVVTWAPTPLPRPAPPRST